MSQCTLRKAMRSPHIMHVYKVFRHRNLDRSITTVPAWFYWARETVAYIRNRSVVKVQWDARERRSATSIYGSKRFSTLDCYNAKKRHTTRPLSHWDAYAMHRGGCVKLYYCNMVEWCWLDSSLIWKTNCLPSVLWHCWFGHMTCKNRPRYDI